jgi:hypothetical protein
MLAADVLDEAEGYDPSMKARTMRKGTSNLVCREGLKGWLFACHKNTISVKYGQNLPHSLRDVVLRNC